MKNSDKNVVYNTNKFDIKNVNLYEIYIKYHPHILLINKNQNIVDLSFYKLPSILICDKSLILDKKNFEKMRTEIDLKIESLTNLASKYNAYEYDTNIKELDDLYNLVLKILEDKEYLEMIRRKGKGGNIVYKRIK